MGGLGTDFSVHGTPTVAGGAVAGDVDEGGRGVGGVGFGIRQRVKAAGASLQHFDVAFQIVDRLIGGSRCGLPFVLDLFDGTLDVRRGDGVVGSETNRVTFAAEKLKDRKRTSLKSRHK